VIELKGGWQPIDQGSEFTQIVWTASGPERG
jgi:hypothetical protein